MIDKLKRSRDFTTIYNKSRKVYTRYAIVFVSENKNCMQRFGFVASKKTGNAVQRNRIKRLFRELEKLDYNAHEVIQAAHPDEDASELSLTEIIFDISGCYGEFALGYDAGESPVGRLYILVKFDKQLRADKELIYETY